MFYDFISKYTEFFLFVVVVEKMRAAFALEKLLQCKSFSHFFQQKI